jgi:hypothetical protein
MHWPNDLTRQADTNSGDAQIESRRPYFYGFSQFLQNNAGTLPQNKSLWTGGKGPTISEFMKSASRVKLMQKYISYDCVSDRYWLG